MPSLLRPNEILSMSSQAAQRLLDAGDGDSALLYLALLQRGGDGEKARLALSWNEGRYAAAAGRLAGLGLIAPEQAPLSPETERRLEESGEYSQADVNTALESEQNFRSLSDAVEGQLGRPLSTADLKTLLKLYDELALPADVILLLVQWCVSETERVQGKGRRPRMSEVKKEALSWKKQGVVTHERAEEFLRLQERVDRRERTILALLDIRDRDVAVGDERRYLSQWLEMGFADDAIRLAYERTVFRKQHMNWPYMHSILRKWHQEGWRTAAQVEAGDRAPVREEAPRPAGEARRQPDYQPTPERIQQNDDQLREFLKKQRKGG